MPTRSELWFSLRDLLKRPLLVIAVLLPLAMATSVSAALFAITDGLLLRPLPFPHSDRLVSIALPTNEIGMRKLTPILVDAAAKKAYVERLRSSPLLETRAISTGVSLFDPSEAAVAQVRSTSVSPNFFELLALRPELGRVLDASDTDAPTSQSVPVVIGHALWLRSFGGDAGIIGRKVEIAGRTVTVVGVMDAGVKFPGETNVWTPLNANGLNDVRGFARLVPGATAEQLQQAFPALHIQPLDESARATGSIPYVLIFGTTVALLLLAWVQVAGLMLSRAADRLKELAVRASMGASTRRLIGLFAADAIWLSLGSLLLAWLSIPSLTRC